MESARLNGKGRSEARRAVYSLLRFELVDEWSETRGTGVARASYWSLRHCPIADSKTLLSRAGYNLL